MKECKYINNSEFPWHLACTKPGSELVKKLNMCVCFSFLFLKLFFIHFCFVLRKTSVSIHIITLYISMIRAEEIYSRLAVVENFRRDNMKRERDSCTRTNTHECMHACTRAHTHTHWIGKTGEDARVS